MKSNGHNNGKFVDEISDVRRRLPRPLVGKRARILIVEDEPAMVAGLRDNFEYEATK
jgi:hypothetical protein